MDTLRYRPYPHIQSIEKSYSRVSESSLPELLRHRAGWHRANRRNHTCPYCRQKGRLKVTGIVKEQSVETLKTGKTQQGSVNYYLLFKCQGTHAKKLEVSGASTHVSKAWLNAASWKTVDGCAHDYQMHKGIGLQ